MTRTLDILLVEDDISLAKLIARWLAPHRVEIANDGLEGNTRVWTRRWDLVITDIEMPGMDGLTLLELIKHRQPETPVLVMSSHRESDILLRALDADADGYVVKPMSRQSLMARVDAVIARRPKRTERTVLAIGAHPDDVEIGVGGTLLSHRAAGDRVVVLTLCRGNQGGDAARRAREAEEAALAMGATLELRDFTDTRVSAEVPEVIGSMSEVLATYSPSVVYTHSNRDTHQDHRAVHEATLVAARGIGSVFCYQAPSTTIDFKPNKFVDVSAQLSRKLEVLAAYPSQAGRAYLVSDLIESTARYWGRFAGYSLVEPLEVIRDAA